MIDCVKEVVDFTQEVAIKPVPSYELPPYQGLPSRCCFEQFLVCYPIGTYELSNPQEYWEQLTDPTVPEVLYLLEPEEGCLGYRYLFMPVRVPEGDVALNRSVTHFIYFIDEIKIKIVQI